MSTIAVETTEAMPVSAEKIAARVDTADPSLELDFEALQKKYQHERDLRLRNGGLEQYKNVWKSGLTHYMKDPYSSADFTRDPIDAAYEVVIVGGGFGGLLIAARLLEAGIKDLVIIEKASDFGGTWYWNRYPGAQCDIESYIYMPLQEELGYVAKEKYSRGPELLLHAQNIAEKYGLYEKVIFRTEVQNFRWNDEAEVWDIETHRHDKIRGQWIIPASGPLSTPKFPGIPGIEEFQGKSFHTCRWDYEYSKGDHYGNLTGLADKRVGIIGTGATAVQVIPRVAESAKHLYVFQRTPSSIDVRNNRPTDPEWAKTLTPGWQQKRMNNFNTIVSGQYAKEDLVDDAWTEILRTVAGGFGSGSEGDKLTPEELAAKMQLADFKKMESIRARVDTLVKDRETAAALKPWYNQFCKRPCFHDEYLQTFNRPNVTLIDTHGRGVEAITKKGVVVDGKETELDCVIYATGFEWQTEWSQRTGTQIYGRKGLSITEKWADGVSTFHGWGINGFPNCLLVSIAQSGSTPNYTHNVNDMSRHFAYIITSCKSRGIKVVEPKPDAEAEWVEEIIKVGAPRREFLKMCTPGYFNEEGKMTDKVTRANPYGGGGIMYLDILTKWRSSDKLEGLSVTPV